MDSGRQRVNNNILGWTMNDNFIRFKISFREFL